MAKENKTDETVNDSEKEKEETGNKEKKTETKPESEVKTEEKKTEEQPTPQEEKIEEETKTEDKEPGSKAENFEFQSEVQQLLHILIYSLYKHKEVFLRELVSNAVDALNKVQFLALTNEDIEDKELDYRIDITVDKDKKKIIIEDTGIGMSKEEIINNIGTIAHSGTLDFVKQIMESSANDKMDLIGQFGVGFYSSFMVAEEIHVHTKSYRKGSKGYLWKSKGGNQYTIEEKGKKNRGTRIELLLKEDEKEYLEAREIKNIINKHSKFVPFPIYVDYEKIESIEAIWTQPKSSLKEKDYNDFFKFFQNANEDPETYQHLSSDAPVQFNSILYISKTNSEIYGWIKSDPGVDLYSRKVLIQKACKDLLPEYFRFIKGVVDSEDIPLNISRESIQSDLKVNKIRKHLMKKIFEQFADIKTKDMEKYLRIWKNFSRNFKEGIPNEYEYREQLSGLLLFNSSKTPKDKYTDLDQYIERMPKDQFEIFYAIGHDYDAIERNPALEAFKKKDIEALYFLDPMDGWVIDHLQQYKGKMFRPVEAADIKLDEEEKEKEVKDFTDAENLAGYMKTIYGDRIEEVRIS